VRPRRLAGAAGGDGTANIVASTPEARVAKEVTTTPIVFVNATDPVGTGLVATLARPGGNLTGSATFAQMSSKRLELLTAAAPMVSRVAALGAAWQTSWDGEFREAEAAANALGVQLQPLMIHQPDDVEGALEVATREGIEALLMLASPLSSSAYLPRIAELTAATQLPAIAHFAVFARAGGLMAYGPNTAAMWLRAATYADKILKGTRPADLPVEQHRDFTLVINGKTAQALGLTIPPHVLLQATEVIQ
jgi:putative tryptophan/tyrosine transport system substrate-binding protein